MVSTKPSFHEYRSAVILVPQNRPGSTKGITLKMS
jgi:hypothetical protein